MENNKIKIAIVEDNPGDAVIIKKLLEEEDFLIDHFPDLESALNTFENVHYDIALIDLGLPGCVGAEAPMMIINEFPLLPIIVFTGSDNPRIIKQVLSIGAQDYLIKGKFEGDTLIRSIRYSIERKKISEELYKQKAFAENIIDTAHAIVTILDENSNIVSVNKYFEDLSGFQTNEIKGKNWIDLFVPFEIKSVVSQVINDAFDEHLKQGFTNPIKKRNGDLVFIEWHYSLLQYDNHDKFALLSIGQDISKRKQAEDELNENAELLKKTQKIAHIGSWIYDYKFNRLIWSDEVYSIFGLAPNEIKISYDTMMDFIVEEDRVEFDRAYKFAVNNDKPFEFYHKIKSRDGSEKFLHQKAELEKDGSGKIARIIGTVHDITEQKELEDELRQSQKMEAVGLLAGGVAHDFNNLLMVILCNCDILLSRSKKDDPGNEDILEIRKSAQRAGELTRQLLTFSRKQILRPQIIDLNLVVNDLEKMIGRLISEKIDLVTVLDPDLGTVKADRGQMDQVILNLVVNSRDAMPAGGKLTIETKSVQLDNEYMKIHSEVKSGNYIMLAVTDTGIGIKKDVIKKIFEPFYTTKTAGKGTGLGLSTVYGIVKQSDGYVYCYSEPGKGTAFKIYFPLTNDEFVPESELKEIEDLSSHGEKIVIIDDEKSISDVITKMLKKEGYEVFEAENFDDIQRYYKEQKIDLLITDVVMPEMNGDEIGLKLLDEYPDTKIIYMSGYTESGIMDFSLLNKNKVYIQKPFTKQTLLQNIRNILNN